MHIISIPFKHMVTTDAVYQGHLSPVNDCIECIYKIVVKSKYLGLYYLVVFNLIFLTALTFLSFNGTHSIDCQWPLRDQCLIDTLHLSFSCDICYHVIINRFKRRLHCLYICCYESKIQCAYIYGKHIFSDIRSQVLLTAYLIVKPGNPSISMYPESKVHGANIGPTWVLTAPDVPHVGPMNHAIRVITNYPE